MRDLAVIADDLSGAHDAGAQIFLRGYPCCSLNSKNILKTKAWEVPVFNTATRLLSGSQAYLETLKIAANLKHYAKIFKKTDSTLRGNIGQELTACMDALNVNKAAFVPAFPAMGRYCIYGRHFLNAKIIENTEFAKDSLNRINTSDIIALLKCQTKYSAVLIDIDAVRKGTKVIKRLIKRSKNSKPTIYVYDCLEEKDLKIIAKSIKGFKVVAGAAAVLKYLLNKKKPIAFKPAKNVKTKQVCFVGSQTKTTRMQLKLLKNKYKLKQLDPMTAKCLKTERKNIIIASGHTKMKRHNLNPVSGNNGAIFKAFAKKAKELISSGHYGRIIMSGGSTAENICKALNINILRICKVISVGIPLTYSPEKNMFIVTKPGGYGHKQIMIKIYNVLKELK